MESKPEMVTEGKQQVAEQLPSVVKSHLPLHLQPRNKKPLKSSTDVNQTNVSTPAIVL